MTKSTMSHYWNFRSLRRVHYRSANDSHARPSRPAASRTFANGNQYPQHMVEADDTTSTAASIDERLPRFVASTLTSHQNGD
jgi:hypothetical protein